MRASPRTIAAAAEAAWGVWRQLGASPPWESLTSTWKRAWKDVAAAALAAAAHQDQPAPLPQIMGRPLTRYQAAVVDQAFAIIEERYGFSPADLRSYRRPEDLAWARHLFIWLLSQETNLSYPQIRDLLARKYHTGMMYSARVVNARIECEPKFAAEAGEALAAFRDRVKQQVSLSPDLEVRNLAA